MRFRIALLYAGLIAANLAAWGWAVAVFGGDAGLLGTALLAYGFGLRHAVDADHIAAIDNVVRKLMQEGRRPIAAGCFFALGHSSIVLAAAIAIAASATLLDQRYPALVAVGSAIGTALSAAFLLAIAAANAVVLRGVYRMFRQARRGGVAPGEEVDALLARRGLIARVLRRLFRLVSKSWHMYPLGVLFGLGFDTASEVSLLALAAASAVKGLPLAATLVFPALFAAGMSLVDATDGVLMLGAYGWAFANPVRKLYYNLAITAMSVAVAALVGGAELLGLLADKFGFAGGERDLIGTAGGATLGYVIVAIFVATWLVSAVVYRLRGYDRIGSP